MATFYHELITSPAFIVMKAASEFRDKTTAPNQLWQTGFTYLNVIGWGWFHLSTVLDDFSRYIIAWKLCTGMAASDVEGALGLAFGESGLGRAGVVRRPRLLSELPLLRHWSERQWRRPLLYLWAARRLS